MPRKKASRKTPAPAAAPPKPLPEINDFNFDMIEDKIRGDEMLVAEDNKKRIEAQKLTKQLSDKEVDARLRELIQKLGSTIPKKKH